MMEEDEEGKGKAEKGEKFRPWWGRQLWTCILLPIRGKSTYVCSDLNVVFKSSDGDGGSMSGMKSMLAVA